MTSVVVADDQRVFLDSLSMVLSQRGFTVHPAGTAPEAAEAVTRYQPDVCVVGHCSAAGGFPGGIGRLAARGTKVLVLTDDGGPSGVLRALEAGASGYVHTTRGVTALTAAISRVLSGKVVVDVPRPASRRIRHLDGMRRLAGYLTARERQCLRFLVEGLDTAQMAGNLGVSPATVRTHVHSLLTKLGAHSRLEAASLAVRHRLLDDLPAA